MSDSTDGNPPARVGRRARRNRRMAADISRSRAGDHKVPTWVMAATLVALIVGWLALIFLLD